MMETSFCFYAILRQISVLMEEREMIQIAGVGVCNGIAMGKLCIADQTTFKVKPKKIKDTTVERLRFHQARKLAIKNLKHLQDDALKKVGSYESKIFSIHKMMLEDEAYVKQIESAITLTHVCAEYAVLQTEKQYSLMFRKMDNSYMQERSADIEDISRRMIRILSNAPEPKLCQGEDCVVLAAKDLLPSEAIQLDSNKVLAVFTSQGSKTSHAAIICRAMGIPTVVKTGMNRSQLRDKQTVLVDGTNGIVIQEPDESILWNYQNKNTIYRVINNIV